MAPRRRIQKREKGEGEGEGARNRERGAHPSYSANPKGENFLVTTQVIQILEDNWTLVT